MSETIKAVVKNHTDTAANLAADNIIPLAGEITFESDTLRFKIGDGINAYNSLPYSAENSINGYVVENITDATDVTETLPDATTYKGEYTIKRRGAGTGEVLIATVDSQTIDGLAPSNYTLHGDGDYIVLFPSGGNWEIKDRSGLGVAQTWQDVTVSRTTGVTYTNTTGKPITVILNTSTTGSYIEIDSLQLIRIDQSAGISTATYVIPNGSTYKVTGFTVGIWFELR